MLRVTVIDDDPLQGELLVRILGERSDLELTVHEVATDALAELEATPRSRLPHFVLLDLRMPGLDGHGVQRRLAQSEQLATVPVVVLSGSTLEADRERSYELGAAMYLPKPDELGQLRTLLEHLVGLWQFVLPRPGGTQPPSVVG